MSNVDPTPVAENRPEGEVTPAGLQAAFDALFDQTGVREVDLVDTDSEVVRPQLEALEANPHPDYFVIPSFGLNRTVANDGSHYGLGWYVHTSFVPGFDGGEADRMTEANRPQEPIGSYYFRDGQAIAKMLVKGEDGEWSSGEPVAMSPGEIRRVYERFTGSGTMTFADFQAKYWPEHFGRP